MNRIKRGWIFLSFVVISLITIYHLPFSSSHSAYAQTAPNIIRNEATPIFPEKITFELELDPSHSIETVELTFTVNKFSCIDADVRVPVEFEDNVASWDWILTRSGNLPPGAVVNWFWTLTDQNGIAIETQTQSLTFDDPRYNWQEIEAEGINLYWYEGANVGPTLLNASVASLRRLESEMGIELQEDVNVFIYGNSEDMREAVLYIQGWAGGVAFTEYNTILMGVPPRLADTWGTEVVPHELAHLVVAQFGRSCVGGSRPTWLDEGLAVYAEGPPNAETLSDIREGLEDNAFDPIRSLNGSFAADHSQAGLSYSQSFSVVEYMLTTYGQEKMQTLLLVLADGADYDEALQEVYGFNIDGLEAEWREAIGAPPREIPPTPTPLSISAIPTYEPSGLPESVPTPETAVSSQQDNTPSQANPICGLGFLPLIALGLVFRKNDLFAKTK